MIHRAPVIPTRPAESPVAFRVTALRASDVVLADGSAVAPAAAADMADVTADATDDAGMQTAGRHGRRRRSSRRRPIDTSAGGDGPR
ncbi:MAG: hypothetical protein QOG43_3300 [Actinomycetota bacterium]|jgi:sarcosine oxidase gamma subunit|nr:hypothetical protein [Actinomycetota bacterium]